MSVNGKFKGISHADFIVVADRFDIGYAPRIVSDVKEAVLGWAGFAAQAGVSAPMAKHITANHILF